MIQSALARPQPPVAGFRRIPLLRFVPFLVAACAGTPAADPATARADTPGPTQLNCGDWGTEDFFRTASPEDVGECLQAGADPNGPPGLYPLPPLFVAAGSTSHPAVISLLVAAGANVHARRWGGITPLHEAAGRNTHAGVVTALVEAGVDPNTQDRDGVAPLHLAAGHGSQAVVTALVAAGADLNVRGPSGKTPLGVAWPDDMNYRSAYRVPVVRELLRLGADGFGGKDLSQITNPTYCGHWHTATFHRVAVPADFARCLEEGADVLARDEHGNTVLHGIVSMDAAVAAVLLAAGAEVNARNSSGTTPLHNAVESRNPATVSALLEAGADINAAELYGDTPLMRAIWLTHSAPEAATELALQLLEAGADPNARGYRRRTPLDRAVKYGNAALVAALLEAGANPNAPTQYGESPIGAAAGSAEPEVIRLLAAAGAEVNRRHQADGAFPLHRAVLGEGAKSRVGALLEAGANPHLRDAEGNTPLHLAAPEDDTAVISLLVNAGADWSTRNDNGETPLEVARHRASPPVAPELPEPGADPGSDSIAGIDDPPCEIGRWIEEAPLESVRDCLDAGAPVDGPLGSDPTRLLYLADFGMRRDRAAPEKIALLLAAGADPNPRNDEADTPLHAVVARGGARAEVAAAALIESGADVNARNSKGWTPLHNAEQLAEGDMIPMVLLLLQAGADVNARTHLRETPLHLAVLWRRTRHTSADRAHVITALLEAGAEVDARTSDGRTPLQVALQADRAAEVVKLLEAGADPAARDGAGILADPAGCRHWGTATFFAVASVGVVASCLEAGADPNPAPRTEFYNWPTLLHVASVHARDPAVIATLVQAGTDVHARGRFGSHPLHAAAEYGTPAAVRALLRAGADPHAHERRFEGRFPSRGGQTPLHGAASNSDPEVAAVLLEAGADVSAPRNRGGGAGLHCILPRGTKTPRLPPCFWKPGPT